MVTFTQWRESPILQRNNGYGALPHRERRFFWCRMALKEKLFLGNVTIPGLQILDVMTIGPDAKSSALRTAKGWHRLWTHLALNFSVASTPAAAGRAVLVYRFGTSGDLTSSIPMGEQNMAQVNAAGVKQAPGTLPFIGGVFDVDVITIEKHGGPRILQYDGDTLELRIVASLALADTYQLWGRYFESQNLDELLCLYR